MFAVTAKRKMKQMYMKVVESVAMRVPLGIDFEASFKSPLLFAPAIMPVQAGKKIASWMKKLEPSL